MKVVTGVLLGTALCLCGCAAINARHEQEATQQVFKLASFDMGCPTEQLQAHVLEQSCNLASECVPLEIGVTGCDKQARYTRLPGTQRWVANSASRS